jgi:peptidoglycan hydrolase CwlO-like protein
MRPLTFLHALLHGFGSHERRISRLETLMSHTIDTQSTTAADVAALTTNEATIESHITDLDTQIQALKSQVQPGVVITEDLAAQIHALAGKTSTLVAGFTVAPVSPVAPAEQSAPTEPVTPSADPAAAPDVTPR